MFVDVDASEQIKLLETLVQITKWLLCEWTVSPNVKPNNTPSM